MHKTTYKILLILSAATFLSCGILKNSSENDRTENSDISGLQTQMVTPTQIATDFKFEVGPVSNEGDTCSFDIPESMTANTDSLLSSWQARTLLRKLDCNTTGWENIRMTDTMYAKRLGSMLTAVRMPYNSMVSSCIDRYTKKNRSQVSYMLGISEFYMPMIAMLSRRTLTCASRVTLPSLTIQPATVPTEETL